MNGNKPPDTKSESQLTNDIGKRQRRGASPIEIIQRVTSNNHETEADATVVTL
jgi:hypothetical protein